MKLFKVDDIDETQAPLLDHLIELRTRLLRRKAFWTAYAHVPKPDVPFAVAIRPARGWCRSEALAPLFAFLPTVEDAT